MATAMTKEEALSIIKSSSTEDEMDRKIELQKRADLLIVIRSGFFDPILHQIERAANERVRLLNEASVVLTGSF
jgi:hypothetical protein